MRQDRSAVSLHLSARKSHFTLVSWSEKKVMTCQMYTNSPQEVVFIQVPRLKYITQSHITVFALGNTPKPPLSLLHYTVWKIYRLIFNDCLLMFNEEIQSALCKFHPLFHYRNLSYVNVGREGEAAVWILIVRLACSTLCVSLCFSPSIHPSCRGYRKVNRF